MNPDDEDDRTVVRPTGAGGSTVRMTQGASHGDVPPIASASTTQHTHTLPTGARLGEFELTQTLGEGGFGIVYLAWDHSLDRKVALKEYMPSAIAFRAGQTEVRPRSERHQETFEAGMKSFINEAKLLAQFDHPALVKVYRFWEANGTAYMVMPFYEGVTVRDAVRRLPEPPDEAWILALLEPLFHALAMLHASQCFHRDIAPDNVMLLTPNDRPLLLDFGAARRVIGDMTQALTAILKPGYAPVEQYAEVPGLKQGPWTDVYALAAVVHWIITGKTPPASVGRMFGDSYVPLVDRMAGRYSPQFLAAIDRALVVLPDKRTPSIDAFRHDMTAPAGALPQGAPLPGPALRSDTPLPRTDGPRTSPTGNTRWPATVEATPQTARQAPTSLPADTADDGDGDQTTLPPRTVTRAATAEATPKKRWPMFAAIGGLVAVAVVAAVVWSSRTPAPAVAQPTPATTPSVAPPVAATLPAPVGAEPTPVALPPAAETKPAAPEASPPAQEAKPPVVASEPPAAPAVVAPPAPEPRAATTRRPAVQKPPPAEARAPEPRAPEPRAEPRPEPRPEPRVAEPRSGGSDREAECARLFARLSIGENNQELIDRVRTLRCR